MHWNNRARTLGDRGFDAFRIDICRGWVYVHENRSGARINDSLSCRDESIRGSDDLVARTNTSREQRKM